MEKSRAETWSQVSRRIQRTMEDAWNEPQVNIRSETCYLKSKNNSGNFSEGVQGCSLGSQVSQVKVETAGDAWDESEEDSRRDRFLQKRRILSVNILVILKSI